MVLLGEQSDSKKWQKTFTTFHSVKFKLVMTLPNRKPFEYLFSNLVIGSNWNTKNMSLFFSLGGYVDRSGPKR